MALRGYQGNRPRVDKAGWVSAALKKVESYTHTEKGQNGTTEEWEAYLWTFEAEGILEPFKFRELTGMKFQPPHPVTGEMNKFTHMVVTLGILTREEVSQDEVPDHDLESAVGQLVRFQLCRKDKFQRIDLDTLCLDTTEQELPFPERS